MPMWSHMMWFVGLVQTPTAVMCAHIVY